MTSKIMERGHSEVNPWSPCPIVLWRCSYFLSMTPIITHFWQFAFIDCRQGKLFLCTRIINVVQWTATRRTSLWPSPKSKTRTLQPHHNCYLSLSLKAKCGTDFSHYNLVSSDLELFCEGESHSAHHFVTGFLKLTQVSYSHSGAIINNTIAIYKFRCGCMFSFP